MPISAFLEGIKFCFASAVFKMPIHILFTWTWITDLSLFIQELLQSRHIKRAERKHDRHTQKFSSRLQSNVLLKNLHFIP